MRVEEVATRVVACADDRGARVLVGIAGAPGSGKSTLADGVASLLGARCAVVPMDGFHLSQAIVRARGHMHRRGAPDTFDAGGYVDMLARLRGQGAQGRPDVVYAPAYSRDIEDPVAAAIEVRASADIVITEGNYLLLDLAPWSSVPGLLDLTIHVHLDRHTRLARLQDRHVRFGKAPDDAARFVATSDEANAALIGAASLPADLDVMIEDWYPAASRDHPAFR